MLFVLYFKIYDNVVIASVISIFYSLNNPHIIMRRFHYNCIKFITFQNNYENRKSIKLDNPEFPKDHKSSLAYIDSYN